MNRFTLALLSLPLAAACGGGGHGAELRPADVAKQVGCEASFHEDTTDEIYVRELGECTLNGSEVSLYTFTSNETRDDWLKVARGFGGRFVVLDRAIITSDDNAAIDAAHEKAGGDIK